MSGTLVARATGIPVQNLLKGERDKLVHVRFTLFFFLSAFTNCYPHLFQMDNALCRRLVGQDEVLSSISDAVRIIACGIASSKSSRRFLFLWPTGVGKVPFILSVEHSHNPWLISFLDGIVEALAAFLFHNETVDFQTLNRHVQLTFLYVSSPSTCPSLK